ncbi:MAG TPA: hypothetical protein VIK98_02585 [Limnochordales bacterium]
MFTTGRRGNQVVLPALLVLALALSGCTGDYEQVLRPPRADVTGISVVAVFPFASWSSDPGLARALTDGVLRSLQDSGWYQIIPPEQVESVMARWRVDSRQVTGGDIAREIAAELGADGFVVGIADYYFEDVALDMPYRSRGEQPEAGVNWRVDQRTSVTVGMQAQLVNVHTGLVVHRWSGQRTAEVTEVRQLLWWSAEPPPRSVLPPTHRRDIPKAREQAIQKAVDAFTADLLPRYEWVRRESNAQ